MTPSEIWKSFVDKTKTSLPAFSTFGDDIFKKVSGTKFCTKLYFMFQSCLNLISKAGFKKLLSNNKRRTFVTNCVFVNAAFNEMETNLLIQLQFCYLILLWKNKMIKIYIFFQSTHQFFLHTWSSIEAHQNWNYLISIWKDASKGYSANKI